MKRTIKKSLSLLLVLIMVMSLAVPAFAKPTEWISQSLSDIPVIRISGDGEKLVDKDGNPVAGYRVQICISGCTMSDPTDANGEVTVVGAEGENAYDIHVVDGSFQGVEFEGATKTPATYSDDVIVLTLK